MKNVNKELEKFKKFEKVIKSAFTNVAKQIEKESDTKLPPKSYYYK